MKNSNKILSDCCSAPMKVVGDNDGFGVSTNHYECQKCGKSCDRKEPESQKENWEDIAYFSFPPNIQSESVIGYVKGINGEGQIYKGKPENIKNLLASEEEKIRKDAELDNTSEEYIENKIKTETQKAIEGERRRILKIVCKNCLKKL